MLRILRRFIFLIVALLAPVYAVSFAETLEVPRAWRAINVGDTHAQVRTRLRESGMDDRQCEWMARKRAVRCTLVGRHHAAGMVVRFDSAASDARVSDVQIHGPVYTGPFHMHARLRRGLR
jgi:hypothetical protein